MGRPPIPNSDMILFVDSSASQHPDPGNNNVGFEVVFEHDTIVLGSLPQPFSTQAVGLIALLEAHRVTKGKTTTIYTDSRYAFGVAHNFDIL